jgi:hypothetical protein
VAGDERELDKDILKSRSRLIDGKEVEERGGKIAPCDEKKVD